MNNYGYQSGENAHKMFSLRNAVVTGFLACAMLWMSLSFFEATQKAAAEKQALTQQNNSLLNDLETTHQALETSERELAKLKKAFEAISSQNQMMNNELGISRSHIADLQFQLSLSNKEVVRLRESTARLNNQVRSLSDQNLVLQRQKQLPYEFGTSGPNLNIDPRAYLVFLPVAMIITIVFIWQLSNRKSLKYMEVSEHEQQLILQYRRKVRR